MKIQNIINVNRLTKKIILVFFGVFLCIALLETGLHLARTYFLYKLYKFNSIKIENTGDFVIMCIGESTTAIGGKYSYPSQLEKILKTQLTELNIKVINKGIPGVSSDEILAELDSNLEQYKPDMLISMMGINDGRILKKEKQKSTIFDKSLLIKLIKRIFNNVSTRFKVSVKQKEIETNQQETEEQNHPELSPNSSESYDLAQYHHARSQYKIARKFYQEALDNAMPNSNITNIYISFATMELESRDGSSKDKLKAQKAIKLLDKAIEENPNDLQPYNELAGIYSSFKLYEKAETMFQKVIDHNMQNSAHSTAYIAWAEMYIEIENFMKAEKILKTAVIDLNEHNIKKSEIYEKLYIVLLEQKKLQEAEQYYQIYNNANKYTASPNLSDNYRKLIKKLHDKKIKYVCVQYPVRSLRDLKNIVGDYKHILYVDNEQSFKDGISEKGYFEYFCDNFGGNFGHCTEQGNQLLANNIAEALINEYFKHER